MRTFLLSVVFTVMVSWSAFAGPPSIILVDYYRSEAIITITRGIGKTETVKLLRDRIGNRQANSEQLHTLLTNIYGEGYTLQSTAVSESSNSQFEKISYILVKP